jgi:Fur family transcriptional regulator, ferric uptake regulator
MTQQDQRRTRRTRQQEAVAVFLRGRDTFASAQEIWTGLREDGSTIGLATVYRAVQALVDDGEIDALRTDDGESVYRHCGAGHHHHLVCRQCGRTVEVEGPAVERWAVTVAAEHGFTNIEHTLEIFGTCDRH